MDRLHLICYDFPSDTSGNKRRNKLVKFLGGHGIRVQFSVFEIRLKNEKELDTILKKIDEIIIRNIDSVRIYPLYENVEKEIIIKGQGEVFKREDSYFF